MDSASKVSALAQPFGVGDAIKSWFGLFNLFLEANQIVIADNLHALNFSDIATSRELRIRQLQIITSSRSNILLLVLLKLFHLPSQRQNKNVDVHIVVNILHVSTFLNLSVVPLR